MVKDEDIAKTSHEESSPIIIYPHNSLSSYYTTPFLSVPVACKMLRLLGRFKSSKLHEISYEVLVNSQVAQKFHRKQALLSSFQFWLALLSRWICLPNGFSRYFRRSAVSQVSRMLQLDAKVSQNKNGEERNKRKKKRLRKHRMRSCAWTAAATSPATYS